MESPITKPKKRRTEDEENLRNGDYTTPTMVANLNFAALEQQRKDEDSGLSASCDKRNGDYTTPTMVANLNSAALEQQQNRKDKEDSGLSASDDTSSPLIVSSLPPIGALITTGQQQQQFHPINNFETFCAVPGRLTSLSNQNKYRVSVGEIKRRLASPECMNASILGGILRKAKNKEGGRLLREQLHLYGVELELGRRKQSALSCCSSLVEQEAVQLATDFRTICQRDYPIQAVATHSLADVSNVQDAYIRCMELFYAGKFLNRILDLHKADQSPTIITEQPKSEPTEQFGADLNLNPEVQAGLAHFSLLTHGFGGLSMQTVLETLISVINECNGVISRNAQSSTINAATAGQQNAVLPMPFGCS